MDEYDKQRDIEAEGQRAAVYHNIRSGQPENTYAAVSRKTSRTIKAHVDKDGHVELVTVGLTAHEIMMACDRIKALVRRW